MASQRPPMITNFAFPLVVAGLWMLPFDSTRFYGMGLLGLAGAITVAVAGKKGNDE